MAEKKSPPPVEPVAPIPPAVPSAPVTPSLPPQPLGPGDERTWGMLSHLSVLLNLITGFGGPIAAIIDPIYKDRSRFVAYHALQSMIFQLIWWYGGGPLIGAMWAVVGALSAHRDRCRADPVRPSDDVHPGIPADGCGYLWDRRCWCRPIRVRTSNIGWLVTGCAVR